MGYVSYNRGFKSGGFNAQQPLPANPYRSEKVDAFELRVKTQLFDHRLRLNPSFFYNRYSNLQVLNLNSVFATVGNARRARMYGVDVEGEWKVTRDLDINFGAEWLNAKFRSFPDISYVEWVPGGGVVAGRSEERRFGKGCGGP